MGMDKYSALHILWIETSLAIFQQTVTQETYYDFLTNTSAGINLEYPIGRGEQ